MNYFLHCRNRDPLYSVPGLRQERFYLNPAISQVLPGDGVPGVYPLAQILILVRRGTNHRGRFIVSPRNLAAAYVYGSGYISTFSPRLSVHKSNAVRHSDRGNLLEIMSLKVMRP